MDTKSGVELLCPEGRLVFETTGFGQIQPFHHFRQDPVQLG